MLEILRHSQPLLHGEVEPWAKEKHIPPILRNRLFYRLCIDFSVVILQFHLHGPCDNHRPRGIRAVLNKLDVIVEIAAPTMLPRIACATSWYSGGFRSRETASRAMTVQEGTERGKAVADNDKDSFRIPINMLDMNHYMDPLEKTLRP